MPRESKKLKIQRAIEVCHRLGEIYAGAESALDYTTPFTLVICVLMSAQTTDAAVNKVTPELFRRWPTPQAMAQAELSELGDVIKTIGLWRAKASHCIACARQLVDLHDGEVPRTMEELTALPGVGRKTANIVLNKAFNIVEGIAVDTHVYRIAQRLRLTTAATPLAAEKDLLALIPHELWKTVNEEWIHFGRETCSATQAHCERCPLVDICPSAFNPDLYVKGKKNTKKRAAANKKRAQ